MDRIDGAVARRVAGISLALLGALVMLACIWTSRATADPAKPYTVTWRCTGPFCDPHHPENALAGQSSTLTVRITSQSTQGLGSANVTVPAPWTLVSVGTPTVSGLKTWTASADPSTGLVALRNPGPNSVNRLDKGQYVEVPITVKAPCALASPPVWPTAAKQSNDFLGTGNDLTLSGAALMPGVSGGCATRLVVDSVNGGADVVAGKPFAIAVHVENDAGQTVPVATATSLLVSVKTGSASALGGTVTGTIAAGTSATTISGITYRDVENGVVLRVTGGNLAPGDSAPFDVLSFLVTKTLSPTTPATIGSGCSDTTPTNPVCITVALPNGANGLTTLQAGDCTGVAVNTSCLSGLVGLFANLKYESPVGSGIFLPLYSPQNPARIAVELDKSISGQVGVSSLKVTSDLLGGFTVVPDCPAGSGLCVQSRHRDNAGDSVVEMLLWADIRFTVG